MTINSDHTFNLSHSYSTAGNYTITVRVIDDGGAVGTGILAITVNPPPVVILGSAMTIYEGSSISSSGSFTDGDSTSYTATVDNYGGGARQRTLTLNADNTFSPWLSYTFSTAGTHTVHWGITDQDGSYTDFWTTLTIT